MEREGRPYTTDDDKEGAWINNCLKERFGEMDLAQVGGTPRSRRAHPSYVRSRPTKRISIDLERYTSDMMTGLDLWSWGA